MLLCSQEPENGLYPEPVASTSHLVILYCTRNYSTEFVYLSKLYYHTLFYDSKLSGGGVTPTSQVCVSAILLLLIVGN
jgi:hypothetical protein